MPYGIEVFYTKHFWRAELIRYVLIIGAVTLVMMR